GSTAAIPLAAPFATTPRATALHRLFAPSSPPMLRRPVEACRLQSHIEADQHAVLLRLMTDERRTAALLAEQIRVDLDNAFHVPHEVIGCRERQRVDLDAFVYRAGILEVIRLGIVVQRGESPAVTMNIIDATEGAEPVEVPPGRGIEKIVPLIPQRL